MRWPLPSVTSTCSALYMLGHLLGRELHVDDRAGDPDDAAGARGRRRAAAAVFSAVAVMVILTTSCVAAASASAPPTISLISWVISAWRAWLASRVSVLISSSALSVADFIARRRDAISEAAESSSAA